MIMPNASALHQRAIVIDGHSDSLMPIADGKIRLNERARRGYPDDVILNILGGNYLRVFAQVWKD